MTKQTNWNDSIVYSQMLISLSLTHKKSFMQFSERKNLTRWILIAASFIIIILILWNTYTFFQIFKNEERVKMEHWAQSLKAFNNADPETGDIELPGLIMSNNK